MDKESSRVMTPIKGSSLSLEADCNMAENSEVWNLHLEAVWKQSLYKRIPYVICGARLRTDLLDNRSLAMLLEISKGLIY